MRGDRIPIGYQLYFRLRLYMDETILLALIVSGRAANKNRHGGFIICPHTLDVNRIGFLGLIGKISKFNIANCRKILRCEY